MKPLLFSLFLTFGFQLHAGKDTCRYSDTLLIKKHLTAITKSNVPRDFKHQGELRRVSSYIFDNFELYCDTSYFQSFEVEGETYKNVIARLGPKEAPKIIIGAHYDVCGNQEGADDNASGVVGLLELTRLLSNVSLEVQLEFVAYTLEEPPFFRSAYMGSYIHAKSVYDKQEDILGMICLEMIGYFRDEKKSQQYPLGLLKMFYGGKGDYITVVQRFGNGKFGRKFKKQIKRKKTLKTKSFKGPAKLQGIDFSDHLNYWAFDYSAVMITNTGFFRNKNYHQTTDKMETLDLNRMALVIDELYLVLKDWKVKNK